jgi:hypothetical protein
MNYIIDIESDFNTTEKKLKNFYETDFCWSISENGYFYDNNPGLIDQKFSDYKGTSEDPMVIAKPLKSSRLIDKIENDETNKLYDFKKECFNDKERFIFWDFSKLDFSFQSNSKEEVKEKIVYFANEYGLLTKGSKIISDKYSEHIDKINPKKIDKWEQSRSIIKDRNYYYFILQGESLSLWLKEIIQMRSLVLLWEAIEKENHDRLKKIFTVAVHNYYKDYKIYKKPINNELKNVHSTINKYNSLFNSNSYKIKYKLFPSYDILNEFNNSNPENKKEDDFFENLGGSISIKNSIEGKYIGGLLKNREGNKINKFNSKDLTKNELIEYGNILLNNLLKIKLTKIFKLYNKNNSEDFFVKFTDKGIKITPPNLLSYMWYELYKLSQENVEVGWCAVCGGPEDITDRRSNWKKHEICLNRESQKKYRDGKALINNKKTRRKILNEWKNISWGQAIDIGEIKEWLDKKEKEKELVILIALKLYFDELN